MVQQSTPDGFWKWILHYQEHNKLSYLNPFSTKYAREVTLRLVEIFSIDGAPAILHMENGLEFIALVISKLKLIWP